MKSTPSRLRLLVWLSCLLAFAVAASAQTPGSISGLKLWLSADSGVTTDGSGNVSTWVDQSSSAYSITQSTAARRPALVSSALNSLPVVRFTAANNQYFDLPNFMSGATAGEVFIVLKAAEETPPTYRKLWRIGTYTYGGAYAHIDGHILDDFGSNNAQDAGDPATPLAQYNLYNVSAASGSWKARLNGAQIHTTATNTVGFSSSPQLGRANEAWSGDIAEIVVYNRVLTTSERETVGAYLASKYALPVTAAIAPTGLTVQAISATQTSLFWTAGASGGGVVYEIQRKTGAGSYALVAEVTDATSYLDGSLTAGTDYTYKIRSRTLAGLSSYTSESSVTTLFAGTDLPLTDLRLWLRADAGIVADSRISLWLDQSGAGKNAFQLTTSNQPSRVQNIVNGRPVVRFTSSSSQFFTLPTFMSSATAGEVFVVLKPAEETPPTYRKLWRIGTYQYGGAYPHTDGHILDDFGSNAAKDAGDPATPLAQFNLYNVSSAASDWQARLNGITIYRTTSNTVAFTSSPQLGRAEEVWNGDLAEIIVYGHVLSAPEREAVSNYLNRKYAVTAEAAFGDHHDTNGDGLSDNTNRALGHDPADLDIDDDTVPNATEVAQGTDPLRADTDGDTVNDASDAFPLDPTRTTAPTPGPGDTTPPTITLTKPANATLNP